MAKVFIIIFLFSVRSSLNEQKLQKLFPAIKIYFRENVKSFSLAPNKQRLPSTSDMRLLIVIFHSQNDQKYELSSAYSPNIVARVWRG